MYTVVDALPGTSGFQNIFKQMYKQLFTTFLTQNYVYT